MHWAKYYYYGKSHMKSLLLCFLHISPFKSVSKILPNSHFILKVSLSSYRRFTNTLLSHGRPIFFLVVCFNLERKATHSENTFCFVYTPCAWLHNHHPG